MIKLVVFDLDGVLVDSKDIHFHALNKALAIHSPKLIISREEHLSTFDGLSTKKKLELLTQSKGLPSSIHYAIHKSKQELTRFEIEKIKCDYSKKETFDELNKLGYQIAVATNAIRSTLIGILDRLQLFSPDYKIRLYSNEDVRRPKPSGEIYLRTCLDAEVDPSETLVIEDSPIGRQAARNAGCHLLPVNDPTSWGINTILKEIDRLNGAKSMTWTDNNLNVVIPMAGAGSRFEKAGYTFPKPLIEVRGKPMIQVVVENLGIKANFIFIVQRAHAIKYNLHTMLNLISPGCKILEVDGLTSGAAHTVMHAHDLFDNDNPLLIANSDQFLEWDPSDFYYTASNAQLDGLMVTFKATHPKWSFAKVENSYITEIAEKRPISDNATAGVYYWRKGKDFVKSAYQMFMAQDRTNNEFYVAPIHNYGIKTELKFRPYNIDKMWGLGTPEDLNTFLENYKGVI
jgi:HAD superfamily hydrolase (TIGR01509 family)